MNKKSQKVIAGGIAAILIGALLITTIAGLGAGVSDTPAPAEVSAEDWTKGTGDADLVLVEYSDFQCPYCRDMSLTIDKLVDEFGNHMVFAYRHLPLTSIHDNAVPAARAAEAAGLQDKFWEMHDKLFEQQSLWSDQGNPDELFEGYAEEIGLDVEQFKNDYASSEVKKAVSADADSADDLGLSSTPTLFLNGEKLNVFEYDQLRNLIRESIQ